MLDETRRARFNVRGSAKSLATCAAPRVRVHHGARDDTRNWHLTIGSAPAVATSCSNHPDRYRSELVQQTANSSTSGTVLASVTIPSKQRVAGSNFARRPKIKPSRCRSARCHADGLPDLVRGGTAARRARSVPDALLRRRGLRPLASSAWARSLIRDGLTVGRRGMQRARALEQPCPLVCLFAASASFPVWGDRPRRCAGTATGVRTLGTGPLCNSCCAGSAHRICDIFPASCQDAASSRRTPWRVCLATVAFTLNRCMPRASCPAPSSSRPMMPRPGPH
jgi:hypothetical protein